MNAVEAKLVPDMFVRIHRCHIVNIEQVRELQPWFNGEYVVFLKNGTRLTLSRGYRESCRNGSAGRCSAALLHVRSPLGLRHPLLVHPTTRLSPSRNPSPLHPQHPAAWDAMRAPMPASACHAAPGPRRRSARAASMKNAGAMRTARSDGRNQRRASTLAWTGAARTRPP